MSTGTKITLREAQQLVLFFEGHDRSVTIGRVEDGQLFDVNGTPAPAGVYAINTEDPEGRATYLGPCEVMDARRDEAVTWCEIEAALDRLESAAYDRGASLEETEEEIQEVFVQKKRLRELILAYRSLPGGFPRD